MDRGASVMLAMALLAAHVLLAAGQCASPEAAIARHNADRAKHSAPALKWNSELARAAVNHARKMAADRCKLSPLVTDKWGQNLAAFFGYTDADCVAATDLWYSQGKNYAFTKQPFTDNVLKGKQVGSFTQVVWVGSEELGCGAVLNASERCFAAICLYSPYGNIQGDSYYLANVKPPTNGTAPPKRSPPPSPLRRPPLPPGTKLPPSPPKRPSPPPKRTNVTAPPPPRANCTDAFTFCSDWKSKGYCAPQWLFDDKPVATVWCPKTCSKC